MDYIPPDRFLVTEFDSNGEVTGAIFFSYYQKEKKFYTRAEWHRFEDGERRDEAGESVSVRVYRVSNKAFVSDNQDEIGRPTDLKNTKWADIVPEFTAENLEKPLSLPSWECGLKCLWADITPRIKSVTPFVGVWIEIR